MLWTLQNTHALTYVLYGSSPPRGLVWRGLARALEAHRRRAAGSKPSGSGGDAV
jgi:hypothetical protein